MVQLCEQVAADEGSQCRGEVRRSEGDGRWWCLHYCSCCWPGWKGLSCEPFLGFLLATFLAAQLQYIVTVVISTLM